MKSLATQMFRDMRRLDREKTSRRFLLKTAIITPLKAADRLIHSILWPVIILCALLEFILFFIPLFIILSTH